ncbi:TadE/TadG family type IV pilus assembly protein [Alsobacter sp. R-9]
MSATPPVHVTPVASRQRPSRARRVLARFARDRKAVAAVEFALLLPVMLTLYIGSVEVSQALNADRRVVLLARTVADLTTQSSKLNATDMNGIVAAASAVLSPLSTANAKIRITSVAISGSGSPDPKVANPASVCWSYQQGWSAYARGTLLNQTQIPSALRAEPGTSIIFAEVEFTYKPVIGYVLTGSMTMTEKIYMRPRMSTYVERSDLANNGIPNPTTGPCT